jgi:hypothetical protein
MGYATEFRRRGRALAGMRRRWWTCEALEARVVLSAVPIVVDLLAVYTPQAATDDGGDAHIQQLIQETVGSVNQAMANTQLSITIRVVHIESINYSSSGDVFTDRVRLETPGDGYMDNIFALRNQYGADLVTLITDAGNGNEGGNADLMDSITDANDPNLVFSAIDYNSIGPGNLTMAHELGHNLGAGHERNNPTEPVVGAFPYSYGYRFPVNQPGVLTATFNDIMSYGYDMDIPLFQYANPNLSINGVPTGLPPSNPNSADLYDTFLQTAPIVANYRSTIVADTTAPTATLFETNRTGASLTFTIRYGDDSGVDLSTIGNGDVTVSGPGGFALPATFVSMNSPTVNGAFKFATYHVILPVTNPATSALSFDLLPNAIKDIHGNVAAAGAIAQYAGYYAGSPFEASGTYASYQWAEALSGNVAPGQTFTEYGELGPDDLAHYYSFTITQSETVEVNLSGFSADCNMYITSDANHDDLDDDTNLSPGNGGNSGTTPEDVGLTLAAGTYYVHVDQPTPVQTNYAFTVTGSAVDTTPPTAVADTQNVTAAGTQFVDFAVTFSDNVDLDGPSTRYDASIDIHVQLDNGASFTFFPLYADGDINSPAYNDSPTRTVYYRLFAESGGYTSDDNGTYTLVINDNSTNNPPEQNVHDAAGNNIAPLTVGSFRIAIGSPDTTRPTASLQASPPIAGQALWTFNVLYQDGGGLNTNSFGNSNIRVTGPASYNQLATFVSATPTTNIDGSYLATYTAPAPGGYWDSTDAGTYSIALQANTVKDLAGNSANAMTFSSVAISDAAVTSLGGKGVQVNGTSGNDIMRFDVDANFVYFNLNDAGVYLVPNLGGSFIMNPLAGDDSIYFQSGILNGSIDGGSGNNSLQVSGGVLTINADAGGAASVIAVSVSTPGSVVFASTQHLAGLTLGPSASASISSGGGKVVFIKSLSIGAGAAMDVNDDGFVYDYTGATPIGTVRSLLQSAFNAGQWNGAGLDSSAAHGDASLMHGLGYAEASDLGVSSFMGQSVDTTAVLVRYTKYGDNNLDGTVDIGNDFGLLIDGLAARNASSWVQGDYTYDGKVDLGNDVNLFLTSYLGQVAHPSLLASVAPQPAIATVAAAPALPPMDLLSNSGNSGADAGNTGNPLFD